MNDRVLKFEEKIVPPMHQDAFSYAQTSFLFLPVASLQYSSKDKTLRTYVLMKFSQNSDMLNVNKCHIKHFTLSSDGINGDYLDSLDL